MSDRRPRFVDQPENFMGEDGELYHVGTRVVGGDGNYEWEPFLHQGNWDACGRCRE